MLITVLMSTYNGEKYLREQLDSILAQKLSDGISLKVLVRDDGSTDGTIAVLDEYVDKCPSVVSYYTGGNLRPQKSFWHLVCNCEKSDYYAFADQDDVWLPNKLQRAIDVLSNEENVDQPLLYCCNATVVDGDLNPIGVANVGKSYPDFAHVLIYVLSNGNTMVFNDLARNEFVKYDMDENLLIMHDRLSELITAICGKIIYDDEHTLLYRQHENNVCGEQSVGRFKSFVRRVKRFLGSSNSVRSERCKMFLEMYYDRLTDEQKRLLYAVAYYKTDKKARKTLMKDKAFSKGKRADFWFRWAVRLKKI